MLKCSMGDQHTLQSAQHLSILDPSLHLERFSSKQLLEASEALPPDPSWVSFTEQWSTRNASRKKERKGVLSPALAGRRRRDITQRSMRTREGRVLKVAVNFEDALLAYGGQVTTTRRTIMPCLPILNASKPRSRQTSEEQLLNSPAVLNHVRLQPSINTPGRLRPVAQPPPSAARFKRKVYLRASNSVSWAAQRKNSLDFDPSNGVGVITGRRFQGSPGRLTPL